MLTGSYFLVALELPPVKRRVGTFILGADLSTTASVEGYLPNRNSSPGSMFNSLTRHREMMSQYSSRSVQKVACTRCLSMCVRVSERYNLQSYAASRYVSLFTVLDRGAVPSVFVALLEDSDLDDVASQVWSDRHSVDQSSSARSKSRDQPHKPHASTRRLRRLLEQR